jgi:hypothetical protein
VPIPWFPVVPGTYSMCKNDDANRPKVYLYRTTCNHVPDYRFFCSVIPTVRMVASGVQRNALKRATMPVRVTLNDIIGVKPFLFAKIRNALTTHKSMRVICATPCYIIIQYGFQRSGQPSQTLDKLLRETVRPCFFALILRQDGYRIESRFRTSPVCFDIFNGFTWQKDPAEFSALNE